MTTEDTTLEMSSPTVIHVPPFLTSKVGMEMAMDGAPPSHIIRRAHRPGCIRAQARGQRGETWPSNAQTQMVSDGLGRVDVGFGAGVESVRSCGPYGGAAVNVVWRTMDATVMAGYVPLALDACRAVTM